ncbi:MAG: thiamine-phosphate kinase [Gammaproteobacteria bacterium RIFCSPHIGHO2_12_FULL_41_20]|nr:MAG: thiamine-phosphate kinase [Gammaproteobacteria bacterium RIFCSPHIGHO2_12_FULL_41_20]
MNEFTIIKRFFANHLASRTDVAISIGDDAAIVTVPTQHQLVITTDTLVNGIHFPEDTTPYDIGYKSLAVNLSDLAAMGATPAWATLALTLPTAEQLWLSEFCRGFFELADYHAVQLIGGDLTHGPLTITVQLHGLIPCNQALLRSGAKTGDSIYVTGTLGDAGLGLCFLQKQILLPPQHQTKPLQQFYHPEPRLPLGEKLRHIAHAAIDISDGFAADLMHILERSQKGAIINVDNLPLSAAMLATLSADHAISLALTAGEDFELCFTAPAEKHAQIMHLATQHCPITQVGIVTEQAGLILQYRDGSKYHGKTQGYQHF